MRATSLPLIFFCSELSHSNLYHAVLRKAQVRKLIVLIKGVNVLIPRINVQIARVDSKIQTVLQQEG